MKASIEATVEKLDPKDWSLVACQRRVHELGNLSMRDSEVCSILDGIVSGQFVEQSDAQLATTLNEATRRYHELSDTLYILRYYYDQQA